MNKRFLLSLLIINGCLTYGLHASFTMLLETDLQNFTVFICALNKNVMRIERYRLDELKEAVTHVSRKMSNAHCSHMMHMGERGQHVASVALNPGHLEELLITTYRGKKQIDYMFNWGSLVMSTPEQLNDVMRANVELISLAPEMEMEEESQTAVDRARSAVITQVAITWGLENKYTMNLLFDRAIESAIAVVVPTEMCKEKEEAIQVMKKNDLVLGGLLKKIEVAQVQGATLAQAEFEEDAEHLSAQYTVQQENENEPSAYRSSSTLNGDHEMRDVPQCSTHGTCSQSLCSSVLAKLTAFLSYILNCECC